MKIVKMLGFFAVLAFVGCGQEANLKEAKKEPKITLAVTCEDNLEKCGHGVVSLAPAGYPNGTTMIISIYEQNNLASRQDFGPAPITQRYGLKDGSYCFTNTNVFKPINPAAFVGTGLTPRSLVEVQKTDVCFTIKAPSDTTVPISVAIIDLDHDGNHDYSDPNPTDPCIPRTDNSACQAKQTGGGGISGIIVGNDMDNDGCIDTVGKALGWCWAVAPATTVTSYAWWTKAEAGTWHFGSGSYPLVFTDVTHWTIGMGAGDPTHQAQLNQLDQDDGPITLGDNRNFSGSYKCTNAGTIYLEIEDPATYASAADIYYPLTIQAGVAGTFSVNYKVTKTIPNRRTTIKTGMLDQGTTCYFWYLKDKKIP